MAWVNSKVFAATVGNALDRTAAFDFDADLFRCALFNNSITPSSVVAASATAFDAGQWDNVNEVTDSTRWPAGGVAVTSPDIVISGSTIRWDADDVASGSGATLAGVYGCLIYDDTLTSPVADQGVCFNYFGSAQGVTAGVFTVVWASAGIMSFSVA